MKPKDTRFRRNGAAKGSCGQGACVQGQRAAPCEAPQREACLQRGDPTTPSHAAALAIPPAAAAAPGHVVLPAPPPGAEWRMVNDDRGMRMEVVYVLDGARLPPVARTCACF